MIMKFRIPDSDSSCQLLRTKIGTQLFRQRIRWKLQHFGSSPPADWINIYIQNAIIGYWTSFPLEITWPAAEVGRVTSAFFCQLNRVCSEFPCKFRLLTRPIDCHLQSRSISLPDGPGGGACHWPSIHQQYYLITKLLMNSGENDSNKSTGFSRVTKGWKFINSVTHDQHQNQQVKSLNRTQIGEWSRRKNANHADCAFRRRMDVADSENPPGGRW
jgi:hypothetical protein